jgi:hypothetical protein
VKELPMENTKQDIKKKKKKQLREKKRGSGRRNCVS